MKILFLFCFVLLNFCSNAQSVDIAQFDKSWISLDSHYYSIRQDGTKEKFVVGKSITPSNYYENHQQWFQLTNSGNLVDSVYFFIGHWLDFSIFKQTENGPLQQLNFEKVKLNILLDKLPLTKIVLQPKEKADFIVHPYVRNFNYHYFKPHIISKLSLNDFGYSYYWEHHKYYLLVTFIFIGVMFAMFLYAIISWRREKTNDYLFYGLYVAFFIFYFLLRIFFLFSTEYSVLQNAYYSVHFFLIAGYIFYALFIISFMNLWQKKNILYKLLIIFCTVAVAFLIFDAYFIYFSKYVKASIKSFTIVRYFLLLVSLVTVFYLFKEKDSLSKYLAWGVLMLFVFGIISLLMSGSSYIKVRYNNFFDFRITFYQIGITTELILFSMALQFKSNRINKQRILEVEKLRIEKEKQEFETYKAVMHARDKERVRIAQEIHDDIGSGLTNIRLLSEIAKAKNTANQTIEINKISDSASELIENMNEIIWSINSKNDNLPNLVAYIRRYIVSYFENYEHIKVITKVPENIIDYAISGDFRRSVFLVVKESLHNTIKHSKASEVYLSITIENKQLQVILKDNGVGFDKLKVNQFSNGLKNMEERIEKLGGSFTINGLDGTFILFKIPLTTTT